MVEVGGRDQAGPSTAAQALAADAGTDAVADPARRARRPTALWRIREDGAGLGGRTPSGEQALAGWEDAAVPAGAARRLPARVRGADGRRTGSTAWSTATSATAACTCGSTCRWPTRRERMRPFVDRRRAPRRLARRVVLRRARRRPRPQRAAAADVLARGGRRCSAGSSTCSTRADCSTPGCSSQPAPARRRPAASRRATAARVRRASPFAHDGGDVTATLHRCTGVGKCRADLSRQRRLHVPVVPGHARTRRTPPAAARASCRRWRTALCVHRRLGVAGGARGARPLPVVQGLRQRLPHGHRHGDLQVRGAVPDLPRTAPSAAALPARQLPRWARLAGAAPRARQRRRWGRSAAAQPLLRLGRHGPAPLGVPRFAREPFRRCARRGTAPAGDGHPRGEVLLWVDSFSDSFDPDVARPR